MYKSNGEPPQEAEIQTFKDLQSLVGGFVQALTHPSSHKAYAIESGEVLFGAIEDGLPKRLPPNKAYPMFAGDLVRANQNEVHALPYD